VFGGRGRSVYRGPELSQGEEPTQASDLYSIGAIAYELLTLREASNGKGAAMSTRHEPLPPPSRLDRRINARLDPIIMRALDASPQRRFKSCGEFAQAIRNFVMASGGMPSREDAKRFVADLFPNEVNLETLGPVPFAEAFTLSEVRGADLQPFSDKSMVLMPRPSFSGGEVPVVSAFEDTAQTVPGPDEPSFGDARAARPPAEEPNFDDGTSPGMGGGVEQGWHAPLGAAPLPKKVPLGSSPGASTGARPAMNRMRAVEDFEGLPEPAPRTETPPPDERAPAQDTGLSAAAPGPEVSQPLSDPGYPLVQTSAGGKPRRMLTEERSLYRLGQRRKRLLMVAGAIALVGAFSFGLVLWRDRGKGPAMRPPPHVDGPVLPPVVERPKVPEPEADVRAARPIPHEPDPLPDVWHVPPKKGAGFLTVTTDAAATVVVDGQKVRKGTPLKRYPVAPGALKIMLVNSATGERREFTVRVAKGQVVKLEERFGPAPGQH
jgi:serine/threonine-protein kinase